MDAYQFACEHGHNYLDIGCGFGRFLNYLIWQKDEEFNYIGYDSSKEMLEEIKKKIDSDNNISVYLKDITEPFKHAADFIMCSAVLIHLSPDDQMKVLQNIAEVWPKHAAFDFNIEDREDNIEKIINAGGQPFRMTWNNKAWCISQVENIFNKDSIVTQIYKLRKDKYKLFFYIKDL